MMRCFFATAPTFFLFLSSIYADRLPDDLILNTFAGPDLTPSAACLCVSENGEVYAGIDLNGSLGKGTGKGRIVKLIDSDHDRRC